MAEPVPIHRSEDEALAHASIAVRLGGRSFSLRPLTMAEIKVWRLSYAGWDAWAASLDQLDESNVEGAQVGLGRTERCLEMLLAYDVEHVLGTTGDVEAIATPDEIEEAYAAIRRAAFPFVRDLTVNPDLAALVARAVTMSRLVVDLTSRLASLQPSFSPSTQDSDPGAPSSAS